MKRKVKNIKNKSVNLMGLKMPKVLLPILATFALVVVFLTVETATTGALLAQLESQEAALVGRNRELSDALVKASSLSVLSKEAKDLGFKKPSQIIYITEKEVVAKLP